jgi:Flp pilus assembly protein TadD
LTRPRIALAALLLTLALPAQAQEGARAEGLRLAAQGKWLEAYKQLRPWALAHPDDVQARMVAGYSAIRLQRLAEAERLISDLPQSEPRVRLLWGELLLTQGNPWGALDMLKPLEAKHPPEIAADLRRLVALARTQASGPPPSPPGDPVERIVAQAGDLAAAGRLEDALRIIRDERVLSPDDLRPRFMEGYLLLRLKRLEEALRIAQETAGLAPDNADAVYLRGAVLLALGRAAEAERDLRQALSLKPDHLGAMSDLAVLLMGQGKRDEARALFKTILAVRPDDPVALANLQKLE